MVSTENQCREWLVRTGSDASGKVGGREGGVTLMMSGIVLDRAGAKREMRERVQEKAARRQRGLEAESLMTRSMAANKSVHLPVREWETHAISWEKAMIGVS